MPASFRTPVTERMRAPFRTPVTDRMPASFRTPVTERMRAPFTTPVTDRMPASFRTPVLYFVRFCSLKMLAFPQRKLSISQKYSNRLNDHTVYVFITYALIVQYHHLYAFQLTVEILIRRWL